MARARSGGGSGSAVAALVFFGAGFFISLLLAVVFYTQVSGARQGQAGAEARLAEFASPSEQSSPEVEGLKGPGKSVVGALLEEREWLRTQIANDPGKSRQEIEASFESLGVAGRTLLAEVSRLQNEESALKELNNTLGQDLAKARERADAAELAKADLDQSYKDSLANLGATVDQTGDALKATQDKIQDQKSTLDGQMADTRSEYVGQITGLEDTIALANAEIRRLLKIIDELGGGGELDPGPGNLTRADGRVVSVIGGRPEVYISLGRGDRLQMGMTFEVFNSNDLIKLNEFQQLRGKATVEVVTVDDAASVARIVRLERGATVNDNDQVVNLAYDPQSIQKFHVYGEFDIDGTGRPNASDRDRIVSMISQWGGKVTETLTYDVDYLVLGAEPPLPTPPPDGEVDPVKIREYVAAQQEFETYQQLIGEARSSSLNIPVLNQNRFLALVGYYDR
jgi:hypothetical protein